MQHPQAARRTTTAVVAAALAALVLSACGTSTGGTSANGPAEQPVPTSPSVPSMPASTPDDTSSLPPATGEPSQSPSTVPTPTPTATPPASTPTTPATPTAQPTTKPPVVDESTTLKPGMDGPVVLAAQKRLSELGYWLGTPDGEYGGQTSQAVMALQKAAGLSRDGVLGPNTRAALTRGVRPRPRTTSGSAIEVDKARQILLVVVDGSLRYTLNTSTGSGRPYTSDGHTYIASTPSGRFSVQRQIDGLRVSRLGELWRPKYFIGGYALHGSPSVPGYPASHGCVRLANPSIDMLWSSGLAPVGRTVWVY